MSKSTAPVVPPKIRARLGLFIIGLLFMYLVLPGLDEFSASWSVLFDAGFSKILFGLGLTLLTYMAAGGTYTLLASKAHLMPTVMVQVASAFTNRLLPAGIGGLTINVQYLRRANHTLAEALAIVGANNTLGLIGHALLLVVVVIWNRGELFSKIHFPHLFANEWLIFSGVLFVALANLVVFKRLRNYIYKLSDDILANLLKYRAHPLRLLGALLCSVTLTALNVGILYLCCQAVNVHVSIWNIFVIFSAGILLGTVTPTPGGLGGMEVGLVAALMSYGVAPPEALATVLLYRMLTFWLPLLPGLAVFLAIRKRYL